MAAPLVVRAFAFFPTISRRLCVPSILHIGCIQANYSEKGHDRRANSFPLATTGRLYATNAHEVTSSHEDDVLYKRLLIEVKGHDPTVINSYEKFVIMAAKELDVNIIDVSTPKRIIERYTQLKSVHIYKKHRVQYETRTHFRSLMIKHITGSTADTFLEYIERNLPEGMAMKVTKHRLETVPPHIQPPPQE